MRCEVIDQSVEVRSAGTQPSMGYFSRGLPDLLDGKGKRYAALASACAATAWVQPGFGYSRNQQFWSANYTPDHRFHSATTRPLTRPHSRRTLSCVLPQHRRGARFVSGPQSDGFGSPRNRDVFYRGLFKGFLGHEYSAAQKQLIAGSVPC